MDDTRRASDEHDGDSDLCESMLTVEAGDRLHVTFDETIEHGGTAHDDATFTVTSVHDPESVRNPASNHDVRATITGYHDPEAVDEPGTVEGWRIRMERHGAAWQRPTVAGYDEGRHPDLDHDSPGHETTVEVAVESVDVERAE